MGYVRGIQEISERVFRVMVVYFEYLNKLVFNDYFNYKINVCELKFVYINY